MFKKMTASPLMAISSLFSQMMKAIVKSGCPAGPSGVGDGRQAWKRPVGLIQSWEHPTSARLSGDSRTVVGPGRLPSARGRRSLGERLEAWAGGLCPHVLCLRGMEARP